MIGMINMRMKVFIAQEIPIIIRLEPLPMLEKCPRIGFKLRPLQTK